MSSFRVPQGTGTFELLIKKSRFIACLSPAHSREEALECARLIASHNQDARHVCWAYIIGEPGNSTSTACNDDGEPSGTAGKPILNVLLQNGVGNAVAVVVRYFGGIKLGAGGLVRAYSSATSGALETTNLVDFIERVDVILDLPYSTESVARRCLEDHGGTINNAHYSDRVTLNASLPKLQLSELESSLRDKSNAGVECRVVKEK